MAVKLRLRRLGRKKRPLYGLVAADSRSPRDGRYIEDLGRYNPLEEPATIALERDRILYWLNQGAQPTDTVRSILSSEGILLAHSLLRKGLSDEEIASQVEEHKARRQEKAASNVKKTRKDRLAEALTAEKALAAEKEVELAKARAEAEAKAKEEADAAKQKAEAEVEAQREAAARVAKEEQAEKNQAQSEADAAPAAEAAEADAAVEEAPAAEAKAEAKSEEVADAAEAPAAEAEAADEPKAEAEESSEDKKA